MPPAIADEWLIHRILTSGRYPGERYDTVSRWPLPRVVAVNDLIDALVECERAQAEAQAEACRK